MKKRNHYHQNETNIADPCLKYLEKIKKYSWNYKIMLAIMKAESSCNENADNTGLNSDGTVDIGLFQINSIHGYNKDFLIIPDNNIEIAYKIWKNQGYQAWSAYNNGKYKQFL